MATVPISTGKRVYTLDRAGPPPKNVAATDALNEILAKGQGQASVRTYALPDPPDVLSRYPDVAWIKKFIPCKTVAKALDLRVDRRNNAKCWRAENHIRGDVNPSLHLYEKKNRVRCFVCDDVGGLSCIDLVMGVLNLDFVSAVRWIAERFTVRSVRRGQPIGKRSAELFPLPFRVGVSASPYEILVRSGLFGVLKPAERSVLTCLHEFRDQETGVTRMSYRAIMRYSGVRAWSTMSSALKTLAKIHAIQVSQGPWIGRVRECSTYRVTLEDEKFLALCNETYSKARGEVTREREFRAELRREKNLQRAKKTPPQKIIVSVNTILGGYLAVPLHPSLQTKKKERPILKNRPRKSPEPVKV
jgi:hypothetical protein